MRLNLFNDLAHTSKEKSFIQNFINELSKYLDNSNRKVNNEMQNDLKQEGVLYQVVDKGLDGVFLQNTKNNTISEEKDIPKELQDKIETDFVLRYQNGQYIFEEELTDAFFDSMVSIQEFEQIKEEFVKETDILDNDSNMLYTIISRDDDYSILGYGEDKIIEVPNALIPFFSDVNTVLKYEDGIFKN